jgi:hypothetical protein
MNVSIVGCRRHTARLIACSLAFLLAVPLSQAASDLPNAPQPAAAAPQSAPQNQSANPSNQQPNTRPSSQNSADNGQYSSSQPVGTAVAPLIKPVGVAASRPAGAAIAPAKQRRIRVLAIRWGLILGGALALGTVAAATMASPRRPN